MRYGAIVRDFLAFLGPRAQDDLSTVSPSDIRQFRDYQTDRMSAASANLSVKVLRNAFKSAIRERLVTENPAAKEFIDPIKRRNENQRRRAFTVPELQRLLTAAENTEWKGLILAGLYLGQRLADIARLRWTHIDLVHAEVSILTEKTGRAQIIPIAAPLLRFITEELPVHHDPSAPLFLAPGPMDRMEQRTTAPSLELGHQQQPLSDPATTFGAQSGNQSTTLKPGSAL